MIWLKILLPMLLTAGLVGGGWWEGHKAWAKKYDQLEARYTVEKQQWDAKITWINGEGKKQDEKSTEGMRNELAATQTQLAAVRNELRRARAERPALQPAGDAPIACGAFEAPPSRLSQQDADFLTGLAAEANDIVAERNTCVRKYNEMRALLGTFKGE